MQEASALLRELTASAVAKLKSDLAQAARCARLLSDEEAWRRENEYCNSVANLLLHLAGNVRQWIVQGVGGEPFERDRPAEFAARGPAPLAPVLAELERVVRRALEIIAALEPRQLAQRRSIQGYDVSTLQAVFHVVEHFSFHTGQIVHMTKVIRRCDLSRYDEQGRPVASTTGQPW